MSAVYRYFGGKHTSRILWPVVKAYFVAQGGVGGVGGAQLAGDKALRVLADVGIGVASRKVDQAIGIVVGFPLVFLASCCYGTAPPGGVDGVVVKVVEEGEQAHIGHLYAQGVGRLAQRAVGHDALHRVGVGAVVGHHIGGVHSVDGLVVHLYAVAQQVEARQLGIGRCRTGCYARTHIVGTDEYVVDQEHEGVLRHAVEAHVLGVLGYGVLKERPRGWCLGVAAALNEGEVGRARAGG